MVFRSLWNSGVAAKVLRLSLGASPFSLPFLTHAEANLFLSSEDEKAFFAV